MPPGAGGTRVSDARPSPGQTLSKVWQRLRTRGPAEVASLVAGRLRRELHSSDRLIFLVRDTGGPIPVRDGLELRFARTDDAEAYARDIGTDSRRTFRERLSGSTSSFLVTSSGRILHASWVTTSAAWTAEVRCYVRPPPGDAYVYESFTRADARGQGLYPLALRAICALGAERGQRRVWVGVENHNLPSLRAVTKAGFEEALAVTYRRSWGRLSIAEERPPVEGGQAVLELVSEPNPHSPTRRGGGGEESKP